MNKKESIIKICKYCKNAFKISRKLSKINRKKKGYCSSKCRYNDCFIKKEKSCKICNKKFKLRSIKSKAHYCSNKCKYEAKIKKRIIITCKECNKKLNIIKGKKTKYCSQICHYKNSKKETICFFCNKKFRQSKCGEKIYCSRKCSNNSKKKYINKYKKCLYCKKLFKITTNNKNSKYCSISCSKKNIDRTGYVYKKINKECLYCNIKFEIWNYRKNAKFCSKTCFNDYRNNIQMCPTCKKIFKSPKYEKRKYCTEKCAAKGIDKRNSLFSQGVYKELGNIKNIKLEKEVYLKLNNFKLFPDFLLNDFLIIECLGDYWHCNPKVYDQKYWHTKIRKFAYKIWENDKIRKNTLIQHNYVVLEYWEYDWNNNIDFFKNMYKEIKNEISKNKKNKTSGIRANISSNC